MKPVFSTNKSVNRKERVFNADKFVTGEVSEATSDRLFDADLNKLDNTTKSNAPLYLRVLNTVFAIAGIALLLFIYLTFKKNGQEAVFNSIPLLIALFSTYAGMFITKKKIKNANKSAEKTDEDKEFDRAYDSAVRSALDELMFPSDAKSLDVIFFNYKIKDGLIDISKLSSEVYPMRAYKKANTLYLTDLEKRFELPIDGACIEMVNEKFEFYTFDLEDDRDYSDPKYSIDGVNLTLNADGEVSQIDISCYGVMKFTSDGEEYGLYIPNYDVPVLQELLDK